MGIHAWYTYIHMHICIYLYLCIYIYVYYNLREKYWMALFSHTLREVHNAYAWRHKKNLIMNWMRNWIWTQRPTNEDKNWMCIWIRTQRPTNKDNKIKFELPIKPSLYAKVIQFEEFRWEELPAGKQISFSIQITHNMIGLIIIFLYDAKQNSVSFHKWL